MLQNELPTSGVTVEQHNVEIAENLRAWERKPLLRRIYRDMHLSIAAKCAHVPGIAAELGSGIGNIREVLPGCLRTDLFPNPWLDQTENAYTLSFDDESVANLILFDVFHHLRYPGNALREFHRVLAPGGRVLVFEPAMSALGRLVFGVFHHEPIALKQPIAWNAPEHWSPANVDYYAAQGNASRLFRRVGATFEKLHVQSISRSALFSYVASGGYSKPQLYPESAYGIMRRLDRILDTCPALFATRMLVVLEKKAAMASAL
ncbi:methyltransferase domain-containing protein [Lysobacter claricitrinus]|uniref:methyltransferase domain-containing protein n=1 Tax=Lysobacter claricitrinus TaxID=3367728 RepID=UPI0037DAF48F